MTPAARDAYIAFEIFNNDPISRSFAPWNTGVFA